MWRWLWLRLLMLNSTQAHFMLLLLDLLLGSAVSPEALLLVLSSTKPIINNNLDLNLDYTGLNFGTRIDRWGSFRCSFVLEHEMAVESARIFDMDCYYQTLIFARRISGMGGTHMLKKGPAWSCSWDPNSSHYMYAGLQNGMLLVFDMRQTVHPVQSINGLSSRPIHTIHSFEHKPTLCHGASLLTASAIGPCVWNTSGAKERRSRRSRRPDEDEADELRDEDEADEDDPDEDEDDRGWLEEIDLADDPTRYVLNPNPRGVALIP
ncbi:hypothetical protein TEA_011068 [Camellia sinensis var. sinensis]|uniref:RING-type E3 ubiquitin transferase n=1 Tax=Camellia sinensis var. sinensis TaxID=542762 RepID=A0A4S4ETA6_CAMSN|nr:hypothetical protein TEA_011068 [Camellia sinensis var. sinensis]